MRPGKGGKHLCRVYCQESHTQHPQPRSGLHHFWCNSKKTQKTPTNQAIFTGKQGVLAQPFNTHLKPVKGILARAVWNAQSQGQPNCLLQMLHLDSVTAKQSSRGSRAFVSGILTHSEAVQETPAHWGWQNSWAGAGTSRNARVSISTRCKGAWGLSGLFSWTLVPKLHWSWTYALHKIRTLNASGD